MAKSEDFGKLPDGRPVRRFNISGGGLDLRILDYGAVLQDARLDGHEPPLVLGLNSFDHYLKHSSYFGALAGRCANRIAGGQFQIDGVDYQVDRNFLSRHCLHGGARSMGKSLWTMVEHHSDSVTLELSVPDGHMGFPGNLTTRLTYSCLANGVLDIRISAQSDAPTLCNLAHHSYWNLDGADTIASHKLQLDAPRYTPVDAEFIPTGEIRDVAGSRLDFTAESPIMRAGGEIIDHNLCLSQAGTELRRIGHLRSTFSGVKMEIHTTEPGIQVYDANKLNLPVAGLQGRPYGAFAGVALEPQNWPDAIHHDGFPNPVLRPGETYQQQTQFSFSKEGIS